MDLVDPSLELIHSFLQNQLINNLGKLDYSRAKIAAAVRK